LTEKCPFPVYIFEGACEGLVITFLGTQKNLPVKPFGFLAMWTFMHPSEMEAVFFLHPGSP
jgi:hypothetical protein